jgi:hypothetical protein
MDLGRLEPTFEISTLNETLRRQGVQDEVIAPALAEMQEPVAA